MWNGEEFASRSPSHKSVTRAVWRLHLQRKSPDLNDRQAIWLRLEVGPSKQAVQCQETLMALTIISLCAGWRVLHHDEGRHEEGSTSVAEVLQESPA